MLIWYEHHLDLQSQLMSGPLNDIARICVLQERRLVWPPSRLTPPKRMRDTLEYNCPSGLRFPTSEMYAWLASIFYNFYLGSPVSLHFA